MVGPAAFAAAWVIGGASKVGYSPVHDAISRLAAIGSSARPLMTGGFIAFGVAVPIYSSALRRAVDGPAWITAAATGIATLAVAAAPLEHSTTIDHWHAVFAGLGYVTLAATPLLAARPLAAAGHRGLARFGVGVGVVSAISLALTTSGAPTGLFQRLGLSSSDVWLAATGIAIASGRLGRSGRSSPIFH
ncbi:MAG: hypothetical protein JWN39_2966 [Ilumatobacteraceae bacterium]|nr:hypothetical protein [Ilumatobacteraceae bacterium]